MSNLLNYVTNNDSIPLCPLWLLINYENTHQFCKGRTFPNTQVQKQVFRGTPPQVTESGAGPLLCPRAQCSKEERPRVRWGLSVCKDHALPTIPGFGYQFSHSVVSDSLRPHEPQHTRPPCPSPIPGVHPNPCPLSR